VPDQVNILLVDDQPGKLLSYEVMLRDLDANLLKATCANEALEALLRHEVAVILIDVCMPELDGFELAAMIRQHPRFQKTALIFISAIHLSESDYLRGYDAGAVDYVPVPVVPELLRAKVRVFAELYLKTKQLESLNRDLEQRVAERTAALETANFRLVQSEEARSLALAAGDMGSWEYNVAGDRWNWDTGLRQIFGVDDSFEPGKDAIRRRIHPEDFAGFTASLDALTAQNSTFQTELRILRDNGQVRWCLATTAGALDAQGVLERLSGVLVDITARKEAEAMQIMLAREVDHRARNALGVVQAIVRLARADTIDAYVKAVDGRIQALAHTHELLSKSRWQGADMERLIAEELAPYRAGEPGRIAIQGPAVMLAPERAQAIGLVLHELATNAAKYGALSGQDGRLEVRWLEQDGVLTFFWLETGCRDVAPPTRKGFGTKIIAGSIHRGNGGETRFEWLPTGLRFTLTFRCEPKDGPAPLPREAANESASASPRVLVVEDEALVGMLTTSMVREMGYAALGPLTNIADARAVIARDEFDVAVIDLNLNGMPAYPSADALHSKGVPFVFVTGYAPDAIDRRFSHVPLIQKPIPKDQLARIIAGLTAAGADGAERPKRMAVTARD
jgi:two-component sensor histidine kinase/DNA-binding response OmpR family regulator